MPRSSATPEPASFSAEERAAMKARASELRAAKSKAAKADPAAAFRAAVAELPDDERQLAERLAALVQRVAPTLIPKTFYGMPAWAEPSKANKIICFFQAASKFKVRYHTFGFQEFARLDEGAMWPTAFALVALTPTVEAQLEALIARAVAP